jgi:hypothetical protein
MRLSAAATVPILIRPVALLPEPLGALQRLPRGGKAISQWPARDEAWVDVVRALPPATPYELKRRGEQGRGGALSAQAPGAFIAPTGGRPIPGRAAAG